MYLGGVPVFAIMMIGQWASDSFMKYIRTQIEEFTFDMSKRMLTMQDFHHTPNSAPNGARTEYGGCAQLMLSQQKWSRHQLADRDRERGKTIF
jgi:hypothetical protein